MTSLPANPFQAPARLGRLQIEITTGCNLKCAGCQRTIGLAKGDWRSRHMPAATFAAALAHCPPADVLVLQGIGEPTLHPELPELIGLARRDGRYPLISFNTNALLREAPYYVALRAAGLSHLSVSVDSFRQDTAERLRGGTDAADLKRRLAALVASGFGVTVSIVLSRINLDELPDLLEELARMAVPVIEVQPLIDYTGESAPALDAADRTRAMAAIQAARAAHPRLTILPAPAMTPNGAKCRRPLRAGYVTVDGLLTPCCVTDDVSLFGRTGVVDQDYAQAWTAPPVARWFEGFLDGEPEICRGCAFNPSGGVARPEPAAVHLERAREFQRAGRLDEAAAALGAAIDGDNTAEALHLLGVLRLQQGKPDSAQPLVEAAVSLKPEPRARHNLAVILQTRGRLDEARRLLEALVEEAPEMPSAYLSLTNLLDQTGERRAAADVLFKLAERALAANNPAYIDMAVSRLLERADLPADQAARLVGMAHRLRLADHAPVTGRILDAMIERDPDDLGLRLARCFTGLAPIHDTADEAARRRATYAEALADLGRRVDAADDRRLAAGAAQVGLAKPFLLSYQGEDDTELQRAYGRVIGRMMAARWPRWAGPPATPPINGRKLRIGFASYYWHFHSVSKLFGGWVRGLDRERFTVLGYNLKPPPADDWERALGGACDVLRAAPPGGDAVEHWARTIAGDELDVLIYPEIGMETTAVRLAALRLAPVQAMAWGHPVTSGLATIDYFLSSDLMEPPDGDRHYTERLVRLPGLSIHYAPLPEGAGAARRAEFGLDAADTVYLCCQFLAKYHPDHDDALARVAAAVPGSRFLFIGDPTAPATVRLRRRLGAAFAARGRAPDHALVFAPPVAPERFPALLGLADVYLDTPGWSGGNTSLEAATAGLPMVTLSGRFMRGRHTTGILRTLGLEELITESVDDTVAVATRLGLDAPWRRAMAARTLAARGRLFNDLAPIRALEDFLVSAVTTGAPSRAT